jgi:iron complex transport system substrate-binding protein
MKRRHFLPLLLAPVLLDARRTHAQPRSPISPRHLTDMGSPAADGVFPRQVRHMYGTTTIPAQPQRIAVISTGQLDAMLTLGLVPAGVARVEDGGLYGPYLGDKFPALVPQLKAMADLGTRMTQDIEAIAQLRPDLILMNAAVLKPDMYARLSAIAPTVATRGNGVNWKVDFLLLASAVGRTAQAQALLDRFHADAGAFAGRIHGQAPTVSFMAALGGRTRIMGVPSFAGGIAEDAGLARPASQQFQKTSQDISPELLDQADADWLFYAGRGAGAPSITKAPLWPSLHAVADGHAVQVALEPFFLNAGPTAARDVLDTLLATVKL